MEHRTKRDVSFLNLLSDFEHDFEKGLKKSYSETTYLELIRFYEEELQYVKAVEVADLALEQYGYRPDFYIIKARLLFQSNDQASAIKILEKAEKISPYEHDILLLKIRILAFQGDVLGANKILDELKRYVSKDDLSDVYLSESFIREVVRDYD